VRRRGSRSTPQPRQPWVHGGAVSAESANYLPFGDEIISTIPGAAAGVFLLVCAAQRHPLIDPASRHLDWTRLYTALRCQICARVTADLCSLRHLNLAAQTRGCRISAPRDWPQLVIRGRAVILPCLSCEPGIDVGTDVVVWPGRIPATQAGVLVVGLSQRQLHAASATLASPSDPYSTPPAGVRDGSGATILNPAPRANDGSGVTGARSRTGSARRATPRLPQRRALQAAANFTFS